MKDDLKKEVSTCEASMDKPDDEDNDDDQFHDCSSGTLASDDAESKNTEVG